MEISTSYTHVPVLRRMTGRWALPVHIAKPGNLLAVLVWGFLLYSQILKTPFPPALPRLLLVIIMGTQLILFLSRRDPTRTGSKWEMALALSGTFIASFLGGPIASATHWVATVVQIVGALGWIWALVSLGRSFGIAPADRGLKQNGPYRFVRHPMYASEILFILGYLIAVPTWRSALIIPVFIGLQIARLLREERILAGYSEYQSQVRWRLLPGIW